MNNPLVVVILILTGVFVGTLISKYRNEKKRRETVTTSLITSRISDCSDLTTCVLDYQNLVKYEKGTIPLVTKKSFSMIYHANIRAGIDLSKAQVEVTRNVVTITIPETEVQSIEVDTGSLRFYDERFALFNWSNKEDIAAAIQAARADAEAKANLDQLKLRARRQAEMVVRKLVGPAVDGTRDLVIK